MNRLLLLIVLLLIALPAFSQNTSSNPEIPESDLVLQLEPLTLSELEAEAKSWQKRVKAQVQETSSYLISTREKQEDEAVRKRLGKMRDDEAALIKRLGIVLDEWEQKGGEVTEYRQYIKALPLINVDTSDYQSVFSGVVAWFQSGEGGVKWLRRSLIFLGILIAFWFLAGLIYRVARHAINRTTNEPDLVGEFVMRIIRRVVLFAGLLTALAAVGVNIGAMAALLGGGAFIIGFAMQETLGNLASGVMLLINRPFEVDDAVEVAGVSGKVKGVNLMTTEIRTFDNKLILVPNKKIWGDTITNSTRTSERRVDLVFGICHGEDTEKATEILKQLVDRHPYVIADPPPAVKLHEITDSSINFICRPWAKTGDYWNVYWDITSQVKEAFEINGISIPSRKTEVRYVEEATSDPEPPKEIILPQPADHKNDPVPQTEEGQSQKEEL